MAKAQSSYHHGDLRSAILEAALEIINERGPQALSIREVARRTNVSHNAPYGHFASKDALIIAVVERGFALLQETVERLKAASEPDVTSQFAATGIAYVEFAFKYPAYYRVMFSGDLLTMSQPLQQTSETMFQTLVNDIEDCRKIGIVRDGDSRMMAAALWSTLHGFISLANENRLPFSELGPSMEAARDQVLGYIFVGIGAINIPDQ